MKQQTDLLQDSERATIAYSVGQPVPEGQHAVCRSHPISWPIPPHLTSEYSASGEGCNEMLFGLGQLPELTTARTSPQTNLDRHRLECFDKQFRLCAMSSSSVCQSQRVGFSQATLSFQNTRTLVSGSAEVPAPSGYSGVILNQQLRHRYRRHGFPESVTENCLARRNVL